MNVETEPKRDFFWAYVGGLTIALVGVVVLAKLSENEKYAPIKQQQIEESSKMNIRVIKEY